MVVISLLLCGYVTHRMGVCLWAGPQDDPDSFSNRVRIVILSSCNLTITKLLFSFPRTLPWTFTALNTSRRRATRASSSTITYQHPHHRTTASCTSASSSWIPLLHNATRRQRSIQSQSKSSTNRCPPTTFRQNNNYHDQKIIVHE